MDIQGCKECKKEVSTSAKSCPHCGVSDPTEPTTEQIQGLGILVSIVVIVFLLISLFGDEKTEDQECMKDLQCWGEKGLAVAGAYCPKEIERLASHSVEWTDSLLESRLPYFRWLDQSKGHITYIGDSIKLENGFGAKANAIYECDLIHDTRTVLDVRIRMGKIND